MISEKLFNSVMNVTILEDLAYGDDFEIMYAIPETSTRFTWEHINIYELAHKCKEWAIKQKYYFYMGNYFEMNSIYTIFYARNKIISHIQWFYMDGVDSAGKSFEADTEPEAIFKACEWILEQKENK